MKKYLWIAAVLMAASGSLAIAEDGVHGAGARHHAWKKYVRENTAPAATATHTPDDGDLAAQQAQYDFQRTAPAGFVTGDAMGSAAQQALSLPSTGGTWQEFTRVPYNAEPSNYTDPFWSNLGAGFSIVGGRVTSLVTTAHGEWFAGAADGGVWRSNDQGQNWTPTFDSMPTLSIGALAADPRDGSLWVGTGEANTSQDSYSGTGVYTSTNHGASWRRVGDDAAGNNVLAAHTVFRIAFDKTGNAYAATNNGLFRLAAGTDSWTEVLDPAGATDFPPYDQQVTDVAVQPGSNGKTVIAAIGWHGPGSTANNGFYQSSDGGHTFAAVTPTGDINATDIGRTTFAYSADGSKLYAIVQSLSMIAAGDESVLQGIFVASGSGGKPAKLSGPWTKIGDEAILAASGSALGVGTGYGVGVQAWYNQDLAVDPGNPNHLYAGLEEVFESTDGGKTWITASPYWNYSFACDATGTCPLTTHPDQHAMMITEGRIVIGNDGGVYSRPLSDAQANGNWSDLNATLHNLQYYDARAGRLGHSTVVWGGLQDNGSSWLSSNSSQMVEPAGGDGFNVIIDPDNGNRVAGEYTDGTMYTSTDGGHTFSSQISPTCVAQETVGVPPRSDCDPAARFVTPLVPDLQDTNTWLIGGEFVWVSTAGWNTACTATACSWQPVYDTGAGHSVTAMSSAGSGTIIYAAWVQAGGNPGPSFASGIATNYGGSWHQINMTGLPNRYISGVTVDPRRAAHAYAVFSGFSRRWIPGGGVGHVFETQNGGQTWTDISGNLPDVPGDALVLNGGRLALGTDRGVFTAHAGQGAGTKWSVLGSGLPNASVNDLSAGPDGFIYAATHGRGVWRFALED